MEAASAEGKAHFANGAFLKAAASFTKALKVAAEADQPALLCNRCASLLKLNKVSKVGCNDRAAFSGPTAHFLR